MADARPLAADVIVVGGGIVGLATAMALATGRRRLPDAGTDRSGGLYPGTDPPPSFHGSARPRSVLVLEAEPTVARHQTGNNSGVVHSGLYYRPGSLKARLCTAGRTALHRFCEERGIPLRRSGKLVVAVSPDELPHLRRLHERGRANGLGDLRLLGPAGARAVEPGVRALAALHVPQTGVVDYRRVAEAMGDVVRSRGGRIRCGVRVRRIRRAGDRVVVETDVGPLISRAAVACVGLQSVTLARASGLRPDVRVVPFRGQYLRLDPGSAGRIRGLVYPVPIPDLPFLGVHLTRTIHDRVELGPNAVLRWADLMRLGLESPHASDVGRARPGRRAPAPRRSSIPGPATRAVLRWPGLWRLAARHPVIGATEWLRARSRYLFARGARRLVPGIRAADLRPAGFGVRAQALDRRGRLLDDFQLLEGPGTVHVINAPSPAATASIAIGRVLAARLDRLPATAREAGVDDDPEAFAG